jgi:CheY-like chemotaxis protein
MGRSILLVEDDREIAETLFEALRDEGFDVMLAADGAEALRKLGRDPLPSVILLDMKMPGMDGYEFRRQQLRDGRIARVPTFAFSAEGEQSFAGLGLAGCLPKPIDLDMLLRFLHEQLRVDTDVHDHLVHFFDDDDRWAQAVSAFLLAGLAQGDTCLAVASGAHRTLLTLAMKHKGADVAALERDGRLVLLDARKTLALLHVDRHGPERRFDSLVMPLMERLAAKAQSGRVHVYGEMVNILWQQGDVAAALALEAMWNALGRSRSFNLLCSYAIADGPLDPRADRELLAQHSGVLEA